MGISRLELYQTLGIEFSIVEPILIGSYEMDAVKEWRGAGDDAPHGSRWSTSFHASSFPGTNPTACGRAALYTLMDLPDEKPREAFLSALFEVGTALEHNWVRRFAATGQLLSKSPAVGDDYQEVFLDDEHWLSGASDAIVLPYGWRKGHCVEIKTTGHDKVLAMRANHDDTPYCVDESTEAFTENGWKRHGDLKSGELVLTLNHESGESEWQPVQAVNRFSVVDEEMVSVEGNVHSSLTTLNHRWPTLHRVMIPPYPRKRHWTTSESLVSTDHLITAAPCVELPESSPYSDAFVELVAWFYTEGTIRKDSRRPNVVLCQSVAHNPECVRRIRDCLVEVFGPSVVRMDTRGRRSEVAPQWREWVECDGEIARFQLNSNAAAGLLEIAPKRVVSTEFIRSLTLEQLDLFIQVSLDADGHAYKPGNPKSLLAQNDPARLVAFEMACILTGRPVHSYADTTKRYGVAGDLKEQRYVASVGKWSTARIWPKPGKWAQGSQRTGRMFPTRELYSGTVWCPTTDNGTWLARRNGTVYFTGNSHAKYSRQVNTYIGLTNEHGFAPLVHVCKKSWAITKPGILDLRWCPVHESFECELEEIQLEPPDDGSLIYSSREEPLLTASYYFGLDAEHMRVGREKLAAWRASFERGELPPHPLQGERKMWSVDPCKFCSMKKGCKADYQAKETRLAHSDHITRAKVVRPSYDYEAARSAVFTRWGVSDPLEHLQGEETAT